MQCRICRGTELKQIIDLGYHPLADEFLLYLTEPETHYPLTLYECRNCGLFQLGYVVPKEALYSCNYPYETGSNSEGVKHFNAMAKSVVNRFSLKYNDFVVDIGSNDGTLAAAFKNCGVAAVGVEPVKALAEKAREKGVPTYSGFFNAGLVSKLIKARIITATNVFAHIDDLHSFMGAVNELLLDNGIFIIEAPYVGDLLKNFEYDTIYHEHLSYFSPKSLNRLFNMYGMVIGCIEKYPIHGGTYRYYVYRKSYSCMFKKDVDCNIIELHPSQDTTDVFVKAIPKAKESLVWLLRNIKLKGKRIVGVSAPAKGNTLLNYCKIGTDILDYITEVSEFKVGKFTPGSHIPVVPDSRLLEDMPDYALILAWNWADQIMGNLREYTDRGGKWIVPIPEPHISKVGAGAWTAYDGI